MIDPLRDLSDDDLVRLGRTRSPEALAELYYRYRPRIMRFILGMTADADLAEEVFSDTFTSFFERIDRYRACGKLAPYLFAIARAKLSDEKRARGRLGTPLPPDNESEFSADTTPPGDAAELAEMANRARKAVAELPLHLREVVVLRVLEGLDYSVIAELVGAGEATVRSRLRYGLEALRRKLNSATEGSGINTE